MNEQLALDLDAAMPSHEDELVTRLRREVAEEGMTEAEVAAAVQDARRRLGAEAVEAEPATPCVCERPQVFLDASAEERRCNLCGPEPAPR
jgi:hypothetical protein